jgi:hypothetical protein
MGILGLGISFRRAPVDLLERVAFTDDDLTKAYRFALDQPGIEEAVSSRRATASRSTAPSPPTTPASSG